MRNVPPWECELQHTSAIGGWSRGDDERPESLLLRNGVSVYKMVCNICGHRSAPLPAVLAQEWGVTVEAEVRRSEGMATCSYRDCLDPFAEWHHFAPYAVFGAEANNWPCLPLCPRHHREWHTRMDGYRFNVRKDRT